MKVLVCYHQADLDGQCSAALVDKHFDYRADKIGVDYHLPPPEHAISKLKRNDQLFIVDFSFKPDYMYDLIERSRIEGFKLVLIDHHLSSIRLYRHFKLPGILSPDTAACELVFKYLYPDQPTPLAIRLLADYDAWKQEKSNWYSEILPFQLGVTTYSTDPSNSLFWRQMFELDRNKKFYETILMKGSVILQYLEKKNRCSRNLIARMYLGVTPCWVTLGRVNSQFFGGLVERGLCVGVTLNENKTWVVHLYSKLVDVEKIAKSYGGGGHKGAAGFVCQKCPLGRILRDRPSLWAKVKHWWIGG